MSGHLYVVGLGPGPQCWRTPQVDSILGYVTDVIGYFPYLAQVADRAGLVRHGSDNRVEIDRARLGLRLAHEGRQVAIVSGGDPGVFAMAATVMEVVDRDGERWRDVEITIEPGVTALLAAAARIGAPLGGDFCAISLSDNLKPFALIEKRVRLAAEADFAMAFYNPASKARPDGAARIFAVLGEVRAAETPVVLAQNVGRAGERIIVSTLSAVDVGLIDMRTLVIVGASTTRIIQRPGLPPLVYTPRFVGVPEREGPEQKGPK